MTPKEYLTLFDVLIAWGHNDEMARHIIHDYLKQLAWQEERAQESEE